MKTILLLKNCFTHLSERYSFCVNWHLRQMWVEKDASRPPRELFLASNLEQTLISNSTTKLLCSDNVHGWALIFNETQ